ncbi:MAG TPA: glycosyl hydrolase family 8 [Polyangia bacterium]|nr:glycosyl hydrolase family 8 [Polyangia bacterium]
MSRSPIFSSIASILFGVSLSLAGCGSSAGTPAGGSGATNGGASGGASGGTSGDGSGGAVTASGGAGGGVAETDAAVDHPATTDASVDKVVGPNDAPTACTATAAAGQPRRPFPQHSGYPGCATCIHPTVAQATMDADVGHYYDVWKTLIKKFTAGAVNGENYIAAGAAGNIFGWPANVKQVSQSEGHGYAMLITALMAGHDPNAKTVFDSLNRVRKAFPSSSDPRLMSWVVPGNGDPTIKAQPPATDGDMDMGYSLLIAYDQWGDEATNHYLVDAKSVIAGMEDKFITTGSGQFFPRLNIGDPTHLGSVAPESKPDLTRPSDYMVDHMLAFAAITGHAAWSDVAAGSVAILKQVRNADTGLVPDFVVDNPPVGSKTGTGDEGPCYDCFGYNSCRVPWRQAVAVVQFGYAGSLDVDNKMATWARTKYNDTPSAMKASFPTTGDDSNAGGSDPSFTSPMVAAGVTDASHQTWLDRGWTYMKGTNGGDYYGGSITLLSMLAVSGNWWIPTGTTGACSP